LVVVVKVLLLHPDLIRFHEIPVHPRAKVSKVTAKPILKRPKHKEAREENPVMSVRKLKTSTKMASFAQSA